MSKTEPSLQTFYKEQVVPHLKTKLGITNIHLIPKIEKVVVNCSVGSQPDRKQAVEDAVNDVTTITGQNPRKASPTSSSVRTKPLA
jgi:large subunit ribosomal protein L5